MDDKYWFFVSYARSDTGEGDTLIEEFYNDLALAVRREKGLLKTPLNEVAFFDRSNIEPGDLWSPKLTEALQTSRVMLCLFSPNYFQSDYCGKEFYLFRRRVDEHFKQKSILAPNLIPIIWHTPDSIFRYLSDYVSEVQFDHIEFGETYTKYGLRRMKEQSRFNDQYREFVAQCAQLIVKVAERHSLPKLPEIGTIAEVENPFRKSEQRNSNDNPRSRRSELKIAYFAYVVACKNELAQIRTDLDCYDEDLLMWCPFTPDNSEDIAYLCNKIAVEEGLTYKEFPIDNGLIDRVRDAELRKLFAICIIDPWSICLPKYASIMREFDERLFSNCGIIVTWNLDNETTTRKNSLSETVESVFTRYVSDSIEYLHSAFSADELTIKIRQLIHTLRIKLSKQIEITRKLKHSEFRQIPILNANTRLYK